MKLFVFLFLCASVGAKIIYEKVDAQINPQFAEVKYNIKDQTKLNVDVHGLSDADDIVIRVAAYSKVGDVFNPFVQPDPIHVCKIHEHEDPWVKFMHDEILKFGNISKACPFHKGAYYYLHDFALDEKIIPIPLPDGEFRIDVNASVIVGGVESHAYTSEFFVKTVKD